MASEQKPTCGCRIAATGTDHYTGDVLGMEIRPCPRHSPENVDRLVGAAENARNFLHGQGGQADYFHKALSAALEIYKETR